MNRDAWYHLLKSHFDCSKKFAKFFLSKGFDILEDHNGLIWDNEKDQCIVLRNEAMEVRPVDPEAIRSLCRPLTKIEKA